MPCSTWTTRSPSLSSRKAAANAFSSFAVRALDLGAQPGRLLVLEAHRLVGPEPYEVPAHAQARCDARLNLRRREEMCLGRQRELVAPHRRLVLAREVRLEVAEREVHRIGAVDPHERALGQVIEERLQAARMEAGEERLEPEER